MYLRARWYQLGEGTLLGRDPFAGYDQQPYSLHPYQYAYPQPTLYTDPSGYIAFFVGGRGSDKAEFSNPDTGVWRMADAFHHLIAGDTWYAAWNTTEGIKTRIRNLGPCPNEPIILVGHSWGGATVMEVAYDLRTEYTVDLVVTLGAVTLTRPGNYRWAWPYEEKQPNVKRHINLVSDLSEDWTARSELQNIAGAENFFVEWAKHVTLDDQVLVTRKGKLLNPAWPFIETAIRAIP